MEIGDTFENGRTGAMLEIVKWPALGEMDGAIQVRRLFRPGMGFRVPHVHLAVDERFTIESGIGDFRVGRRSLRLGPREEFWVPRNEVHIGPRNRSTQDLVFLQTLMAARTNAAQRYIETLAKFTTEGRDAHGDLPPVVAAAVFAGADQQTFAPLLPRSLQHRVLFPLAKLLEERRERCRTRRKQSRTAADAADATFWHD